MAEHKGNNPSGEPTRVLRCDEWESLIADALDGTLSAVDAAAFSRHQGECTLCSQMLKETQLGKSWMEYLAEEPQVPEGLLDKILARTSGHPQSGLVSGLMPPVRPQPAGSAQYRRLLTGVRPVLRQVFEPRLMMTAAMAFFSIALTLNLTGIKLSGLHAADLQPTRLKATLTRQYYSTNEQVMKYYENLRVVYEMEARVRELRRSSGQETAPAQAPSPKPRERDGSPSSTAPTLQPVPHGEHNSLESAAPIAASFHPQGKEKVAREVFKTLRTITACQGNSYQAKRSLV